MRGFQGPLYSGLSTSGAVHLPLNAGLGLVGRVQGPQPGALSLAHLGLGTEGASQAPSSSSSQSSGCEASGSGIDAGSSSSHPSGLTASSSSTSRGASSSQSAGFFACGSGIFWTSTQSSGFLSSASSTSLGGENGGSNSAASSSEPDLRDSPSTSRSNDWLDGRRTSVYTCVSLSAPLPSTSGGETRWRSATVPLGCACLTIRWTLFVAPHLSGPNMTEKGVVSTRSSALKSESTLERSLA